MNCEKRFLIFEYLYRDGANYKAWGEIRLIGILTTAQINEIKDKLQWGDVFVAEQVNIPTLYHHLYQYSADGPTIDDHAFHEFSTIRKATPEEIQSIPVWGTAKELLEAFRSVKSWDVTLSPHCF
ncbi:MAG: hypothetical protein U1F63_13205 [Chitinivorax sp.]